MSHVPEDLKYTMEHEYLRETDQPGVYAVGITDYAQAELGDIVYLELPEPGDSFAHMEAFGTIEAVKAVNDIYCPVAGEVVDVNEAVHDDPSLVNTDPYGEGWMVKLRVDDVAEVENLLDSVGYELHIDGD